MTLAVFRALPCICRRVMVKSCSRSTVGDREQGQEMTQTQKSGRLVAEMSGLARKAKPAVVCPRVGDFEEMTRQAVHRLESHEVITRATMNALADRTRDEAVSEISTVTDEHVEVILSPIGLVLTVSSDEHESKMRWRGPDWSAAAVGRLVARELWGRWGDEARSSVE